MRYGSVMLRRQQDGFTYLMVMMAVVLLGLALTMTARQWKVMVQRELEVDLLTKGLEIQTALALYSANAKAGRVFPGEVYPRTLDELTKPPKPFLRKVYTDPVGHGEWELLRAPTGGIMGVRSKSKSKPIKEGNFPLAVRHFQGKQTYYDWVFQHPSPSMAAVAGPGERVSPRQPGIRDFPENRRRLRYPDRTSSSAPVDHPDDEMNTMSTPLLDEPVSPEPQAEPRSPETVR